MSKGFRTALYAVLLSLTFLISCQVVKLESFSSVKPTNPASIELLPESKVQEITLVGPASESRAEISGMAWCGDNLVLLPQYPSIFGEDDSANVFNIPQENLDDYFSGEVPEGLAPELIPFDTGGLEQTLTGFEGYEGIVFNGSEVYVTIEARQWDGMMGYLVKGEVVGDCDGFILDPKSVIPLEPQVDISNMSHEALVIYQNQLYVIFEANGNNVNPNPVAHVFDFSLESHTTVDLPNIEYRLPAAAMPDETGAFWAVNYFFPGEASDLEPAVDQIGLDYGIGFSHYDANPVERLVKFRIDDNSVQLVDQPPIYLELMDGGSRNWEGVVQYGHGFLLVTDKFPTTILAYVEAEGQK